MIFKSDAKSKTRHCLLSISFASLSIFLLPEIAFSQCNQIYDWADWTSYTSNSASGKINTNGQVVDVVMSANYDFGNSTNIFGFDQFSGFNGTIPNSDVPETTWAIGAGGITTMCFSQTVSNPVLLLASIGRPGTPVTLKFSRSYSPIYTGTNVQYVNDSTIIGEEGYTILMFPGDFDCVTIYSNTPEYYTNITWGLNPPLFPISITGALVACNSTTLVASGGSSYVWSGGNNPNSASNTITESGQYFLTITDGNGCTVVTSRTVEIVETAITTSINQSICESESYFNYSTTGIYIDTFVTLNGCDSIRTLTLTVKPNATSQQNVSICQGENYEGYSASGVYTDTIQAANGCDSVRTIALTVNPSYEFKKYVTICKGETYEFNGETLSMAGMYDDEKTTWLGCDSNTVLNLNIADFEFLGNDTTICSGREFLLQSPSAGTVWFDNTTGTDNMINNTGKYWATVIDSNGCAIVDTIFVRFNFKYYTPNVFSPNDDGINDCFQPYFSDLEKSPYSFDVFDRWGNQLFSTKKLEDCWNGESRGKQCGNDVYIYQIKVETEYCGETLIKGDINLLR